MLAVAWLLGGRSPYQSTNSARGAAEGSVDSWRLRILVLSGRMAIVPKPFPVEYRRDVVAVARKGEAPLNQIAKDFGISEAMLHNWLKKADVEDASGPV